MLKHEYEQVVYKFAQCITCNEIGTVGYTLDDFNAIVMFLNSPSYVCLHCCYTKILKKKRGEDDDEEEEEEEEEDELEE